MSGRWFRFYNEALNDPKVQNLDGDAFKDWINILCIASANDGVLPDMKDIAFAIRKPLNDAVTVVERLVNATLIDRCNGGPNGYHYAPHNWDKRQFKSDTSNERVKRYRKRNCNVTVTPPEADTEADTDLLDKSNKSAYAFHGKVIRLTQADYDQWAKSFSRLDLSALLQSRDDWLFTQDAKARKNWYKSTSNWLASKSSTAAKPGSDDLVFAIT